MVQQLGFGEVLVLGLRGLGVCKAGMRPHSSQGGTVLLGGMGDCAWQCQE